MRKAQMEIIGGLGIVAGIVIGVLLLASFTTVPTGYTGIKTSFGVVVSATGQGLIYHLPFIENVVVLNIQKQKVEVDADAGTKDIQKVMSSIAVNYHIDSNKIMNLYSEIGTDFTNKIINPAIEEATKATVARFTASECITNREDVKVMLVQEVKDRLEKYYLIVDDVSVVNFAFSKVFDDAVEAKVKAEQDVLKERQELEKIKVQAEQTIAQATAQAEAQRLQQQTLSSELLQKYWIDKWDGKLPQVVGKEDLMIGLK